ALRLRAGRDADAAAARRLYRQAAADPRARGRREAGGAPRGALAHHRAGGPRDRCGSIATGRLGAGRWHALWPWPALFEGSASRSSSTRALFANLLGRGALYAADRLETGDSFRADRRADRRRSWSAVRRRAYRRGDKA